MKLLKTLKILGILFENQVKLIPIIYINKNHHVYGQALKTHEDISTDTEI